MLKSAKTPSMMATKGESFVFESESAFTTFSDDAATDTRVPSSRGDRNLASSGSVVVRTAGLIRTAWGGGHVARGARARGPVASYRWWVGGR